MMFIPESIKEQIYRSLVAICKRGSKGKEVTVPIGNILTITSEPYDKYLHSSHSSITNRLLLDSGQQ